MNQLYLVKCTGLTDFTSETSVSDPQLVHLHTFICWSVLRQITNWMSWFLGTAPVVLMCCHNQVPTTSPRFMIQGRGPNWFFSAQEKLSQVYTSVYHSVSPTTRQLLFPAQPLTKFCTIDLKLELCEIKAENIYLNLHLRTRCRDSSHFTAAPCSGLGQKCPIFWTNKTSSCILQTAVIFIYIAIYSKMLVTKLNNTREE